MIFKVLFILENIHNSTPKVMKAEQFKHVPALTWHPYLNSMRCHDSVYIRKMASRLSFCFVFSANEEIHSVPLLSTLMKDHIPPSWAQT